MNPPAGKHFNPPSPLPLSPPPPLSEKCLASNLSHTIPLFEYFVLTFVLVDHVTHLTGNSALIKDQHKDGLQPADPPVHLRLWRSHLHPPPPGRSCRFRLLHITSCTTTLHRSRCPQTAQQGASGGPGITVRGSQRRRRARGSRCSQSRMAPSQSRIRLEHRAHRTREDSWKSSRQVHRQDEVTSRSTGHPRTKYHWVPQSKGRNVLCCLETR